MALLRDEGRARLAKLLMRARRLTRDMPGIGDTAMLRFIDWLEPLLRRDSYLALLAERSEVLGRLLHLLGLVKMPIGHQIVWLEIELFLSPLPIHPIDFSTD